MKSLDKAIGMYKHRTAIRALVENHLWFSQTLDVSVWGSLPPKDREELMRLVRLAGQFPGPIIEIGTLFGFTTQLMAEAKRADQDLFTIDNYSWNPFSLPPEHHRAFTHSALHFCMKNTRLTLFEGDSNDFFESYDGTAPALVFLDGSHDYDSVVQEIQHAKRLGAAIICGDDHSETFPGLVAAVHEEFGDTVTVKHSVWSATLKPVETKANVDSASESTERH